MTKKQLILVLASACLAIISITFFSTLGSRSVEVKIKNNLSSAPVYGVAVNVDHVIPSTQTVSHQIFSSESKYIIFDQGDSMHFSAQDYKPLALKYIDITYLDLIGVTLYKSSQSNSKITGKIHDWRNPRDSIDIECDKCLLKRGSFKNDYSFDIDPANSTSPITLTYRLGPSKKIEFVLTPPNDGHATIDIAFDDSSTKGNRWLYAFKKIKRKFNL